MLHEKEKFFFYMEKRIKGDFNVPFPSNLWLQRLSLHLLLYTVFLSFAFSSAKVISLTFQNPTNCVALILNIFWVVFKWYDNGISYYSVSKLWPNVLRLLITTIRGSILQNLASRMWITREESSHDLIPRHTYKGEEKQNQVMLTSTLKTLQRRLLSVPQDHRHASSYIPTGTLKVKLKEINMIVATEQIFYISKNNMLFWWVDISLPAFLHEEAQVSVH